MKNEESNSIIGVQFTLPYNCLRHFDGLSLRPLNFVSSLFVLHSSLTYGVYLGLFLKRKQETEVGHGECRGKAKGLNNYHGLYVSIGYRF